MSTARQRYMIRKRHRLENERHWKAQKVQMLEITTPGCPRPKTGTPLKGKVKAMLRGQRGILRESQFDQSSKVSLYMPGTKIRGKMGPSGWKKMKTWLRKDES